MNPTDYSEEQIQLMAREIAAATKDPKKVEEFFALARTEQARNSQRIGAVGEAEVQSSLDQAVNQATQKVAREMTPAESAAYVGNQLLNMGTVGTMAASGQSLGAMTGPLAPVAVPALGALGAGAGEVMNMIRQGEPIQGGRIVKSMAIGSVPIAGPASLISREAFKNLTAAEIGEIARTLVDEKRLPTIGEQAEQVPGAILGATIGVKTAKAQGLRATREMTDKLVAEAGRNQTVKQMVSDGYKVDPGLANRSTIASELGGAAEAGGGTQLQRAASLQNQNKTNLDGRADIGLPKGMTDRQGQFQPLPLTNEVLLAHSKKLAEPHKQIRAMSDEFGKDLDNISNLRADKNAAWFQYRNPNNPNSLTSELRDKAIALDRAVEKAESALEQKLIDVGRQDLMQDYRSARRLISKTEVVRNALKGNDIDASLIAAQYDKGMRNLDGALERIALYYETMPQVMMHRASVRGLGPVGFTPSMLLTSGAGAGLAAVGAGTMGASTPAQAATAFLGAAAAPAVTRRLMLSPFYQQSVMTERQAPAFGANLLRFAGQSGLSQ